jgi:hypothetical protein
MLTNLLILTVPVDPSLIGFYTFNSNNRLLDSTGRSGNLIASSAPPSYTSDCQWAGSECAVLSSNTTTGVGNEQYFRFPTVNLGQMSASSGFSICVWFVLDVLAPSSRVFDFGGGAGDNNVLVSFEESNHLYLGYFNNGTSESITSQSGSAVGVWRHVCVVNQGTAWQLYENGTLSGSKTSAFNLNPVALTSNFLGRSNEDGNKLLRGKLDEFRMYSRALTGSDVASVYVFRGVSFCFNP